MYIKNCIHFYSMLEAFCVIKFWSYSIFHSSENNRKHRNMEKGLGGGGCRIRYILHQIYICIYIYIASQSIESIYTKWNGCLPEDDMDKLDEDDDVTGAVKRV